MSLPLYSRPYVELDFTRMVFDSRVSFSRSTTATRFRADKVLESVASNTPRIDHAPLTGAVRGLLLEEQRTNLIRYSQEFDTSAWSKGACSIAPNVAIAPDGTTTADKTVESTANAEHYFTTPSALNSSLTDNTVYTVSCFIKPAGRNKVQFACRRKDFTFARCIFDLVAKTASSLSNVTSTQISDVGSGWVRCAASFDVKSGAGGVFPYFALFNGTVSVYAGDGVSGVYQWGFQVEAGSFATSYIPTTTAAVTRAADVASFTIPPRVVRLVTIYDDGTTNTETVTPGATYTIPTGTKPILRIRGYYA